MKAKVLEELINSGLSTREIAEKLDKSQTNVRYWLSKYGLKTQKNKYNKGEAKPKICRICGSETKRRNVCNSCGVSIRRTRCKIAAVKYLSSECKICGWKGKVEEYSAYEFHHRDPNEKDFTVSGIMNKSWDVVKEELNKCDLVCSRCHNILHSSRFRDDFVKEALNYKGHKMDGLV
ncbi:MAG: hypothetical protein COT73_02015 [Bdellovibrio sp. CG10_big_fil_rev_8_21_14_0_10_47_8]|nr:MAG: hypothetical protein COT73_02015 [Bdellovibrio sp. CG10_big_fil_rev_8_21_14_0_10_47_8]